VKYNSFMSTHLFIHATNIHQGGGRTLLHALLMNLLAKSGTVALLDTRLEIPKGISPTLKIKKVKPSIFSRLRAELWLANNVKPEDIILCFGNLPPLFEVKGYTVVFLQNRYLVDSLSLTEFTYKARMRIRIERLWLFKKVTHVNEFIVQTPSMKALVKSCFGPETKVKIQPFINEVRGYSRRLEQQTLSKSHYYDFIYVALGDPHKNHKNLIEAWCLLAQEGVCPSLCLTVDNAQSPKLFAWMERKKHQYSLCLENLGLLTHCQVKKLFSQAGALIYPSFFESFGLPLIEARQANLKILAGELDYVRDLLDPEESFDPGSPISIARAVKRFLGVGEPPLQLQDAKDFIAEIMRRGA
jgi:glycosyltransferase involved in cell wall biosynthesis